MTTEVEWRRRWKPDLEAFPWQPIRVDGSTYLLKYMFTTDSYKVLLTDLANFWHEELADQALQKRIKKLNPGIEAPVTRILDQIKGVLDKTQDDPNTSIKLSFKREADSEERKVMLVLHSELAGMPFIWNFQCRPADKSMGSEHLILPLMAMVGELTRRQQELFKIIQGKDKQIEDYKSQGAKCTRKHIETPAFVETAFEMNMMTSKAFEQQIKGIELKTFDVKTQDLYRQIMSKRAWVNRSPTKATSEDESLLDDMSSADDSRRTSTGQSWGNSRLPPSLQQSKSPTKSPAKSPNKTPSPSKSSNNSTPETSPVKDTELLRRQALERKLELEESKKMEKAKKKKKIAF
ncbi:non-homologous end-joining factor 1-like [Mercenaria mercenaria]|uniref:non-homologous end-joining factor 1-like n=1 Tax=Mercenaria mercenaria TaxID=6596 RepID=UPI001E1DE50E|nr:non-homologous end-joining factor 1-like [Mercenaria mercenaria]